MFDDARPSRTQHTIWLALPRADGLTCARCNRPLDRRNVAAYTRTRPADAFDPWCHGCFYVLVRWAGIGALETEAFDTDDHADTMRELLSNGRN